MSKEDHLISKQASVAIVIPVYNAEKYLRKCIKSILHQTFTDFVLILVDDGSKDASGRICDKYAQSDTRIVVIHQNNKGGVEARKAGVLSEYAQRVKYITFVDADDTLNRDALKILYTAAEKKDADYICAQIQRMWNGVKISSKYKQPCFYANEPIEYTHCEIIEKLYISCFGVTNFPVTLCAKLYKTILLTEAIDFPPVVNFMGDDLSVTLRYMPIAEKLVIVPQNLYNYRIGGNTSKFNPHMLDDFISLYNYKSEFAEKYSMTQNVRRYMNIELINCVRGYFVMCAVNGKFSKEKILKEIKCVAKKIEICSAVEYIIKNETSSKQLALWLKNENYEMIVESIYKQIRKNKYKTIVKKILKAL